MERQTFLQLLDKYLNGTASPVEQSLLEEYYKRLNEKSSLQLSFEEEQALQQAMLKNIRQHIHDDENVVALKPRRSRLLWYAAAASILVFLSVGLYFYQHRSTNAPLTAHNSKQDIAPGGNKAILTLANGRKIILTHAKNGTIAKENQVAINKTANGQLVYAAAAATAPATTTFNSIQTPRGGQYHLVLADGTNVWLNAASSLKYPIAFAGKERRVELTGEAYFEVVHNKAKPFRVTTGDETIEDIGTHFNVYAYGDEKSVKTTLLQGSVMVSSTGNKVILKPGEQSNIVAGGTKINVINNADTEEAIAWKNGFFEFNKADIPTVMRSLGRWYDVEIAYDGNIPERRFSGEMHRDVNISEALKILSYLKINFRVEGRKIIVTNNNSN